MNRVIAVLNTGNQKIQLDGQPKERFDFEKEEVEVVFVFPKNSLSYMELSHYGFGGSIVPRFEMKVNNIDYSVIACGAKNDLNNEISFFLMKNN